MRTNISLTILSLLIVKVISSDISELKCEEYQTELAKFAGDNDANEFSYMVRVFIGNEKDYRNGALISESFVLSSAAEGLLQANASARVEIGFLATDKNRTKSIAISDKITQSRNRYSMCLLKLVEPIQFNEFIIPICLSNGPTIVNGQYKEASIRNGLKIRNVFTSVVRSSGDTSVLISGEECDASDVSEYDGEHGFAGSILVNELGEMAGMKPAPYYELCNQKSMLPSIGSSYYCGSCNEYIIIQTNLDWIEQNVWPTTTEKLIQSNTCMKTGYISAVALIIVFINVFLRYLN